MILFPGQEKKLKTIWRVEKNGRGGLLVGTAHFSPCSFRKTLTRLIQGSETILFEGPLDEESMANVARYGRRREETPSVYDALDPAVIREINRKLAARSGPATTTGSCLDLIYYTNTSGFLEENARRVRPWMAFFTTWSAFLNWKYSMDVEAFRISRKLGKEIEYLETIEDQLEALDGIPFDRIMNYFKRFQEWGVHRESFARVFLEENLPNTLSITEEFPTRCESIIGKRDLIFFNGLKAAFQKRQTTAFIGIGHIPGLCRLFLADGFVIIREEPC